MEMKEKGIISKKIDENLQKKIMPLFPHCS